MSNKSYLIKDTTKEERAKIIKEALAVSSLDCKEPIKKDMKLYERYVDGEMELDEIKRKIIEKYTEM